MTTTIGMRRRTVSLITAAAFAGSGAFVLATGPAASATPGDPHKVWVCKYVQKPGVNEVLKGGKNPIFVDYASLTSKKTEPFVGEEFQDAHILSVVVQIGGSNPGVEACKPKTPPTEPTKPTEPTEPTKPTEPTEPTKPTKSEPPKTETPVSPAPTQPGGGGGVTPGVGAPDTGGEGESSPANGLIGSGLLLAAAGVLGAEALRRRRESTES